MEPYFDLGTYTRGTSTENIAYSGTAGTYYWRVYSYSGGGAFVFGMTRP